MEKTRLTSNFKFTKALLSNDKTRNKKSALKIILGDEYVSYSIIHLIFKTAMPEKEMRRTVS